MRRGGSEMKKVAGAASSPQGPNHSSPPALKRNSSSNIKQAQQQRLPPSSRTLPDISPPKSPAAPQRPQPPSSTTSTTPQPRSSSGQRQRAAVMPTTLAGEELTVICQYMDVVSSCIGHRVRTIPPPPKLPIVPQLQPSGTRVGDGTDPSLVLSDASTSPTLRQQSASPVPQPPALRSISSDVFQTHKASLVERLQKIANGFLHWYAIVETKTIPLDITMDTLQTNLSILEKDLLSILNECLQRCLTLVEQSGGGGEVAMLWATHKCCVDECFAVIGTVIASAKTLLMMRRVVYERDEVRARQFLQDLMKMNSAVSVGPSAATSAFARWVEVEWLPAMSLWKDLIQKAKREAAAAVVSTVEAPHVAATELKGDTGDRHRSSVERVIVATHREAATRSSSLREILRPGETVDTLLHEHVDTELRNMSEVLSGQKKALDALRHAVDNVDFVRLASCLRATDMYAATIATREDKALISEAQQLLVDVQHVAKTTVSLTLAVKTGELLALARAVHAANETIHKLRVFNNEDTIRVAIERGRELVEALAPPGGSDGPSTSSALVSSSSSTGPGASGHTKVKKLLASFDVHVLFVDHVPSRAWAPELSLLYQKGCNALEEAFTVESLEMRLHEHLSLLSASRGVGETAVGEDDGEQRRQLPSTEDLKHLVDQCHRLGIATKAVTEAEQLLQRNEQLRIKVHFDSRIRVVVVDLGPTLSFREVVKRVQQACSTSSSSSSSGAEWGGGQLRIRYQDSDGDFISLVDEADWTALMNEIQRGGGGGGRHAAAGPKLDLYCDIPALPSAMSPFTKDSTARGGGGRPQSFSGMTSPNRERDQMPGPVPQRRLGTPSKVAEGSGRSGAAGLAVEGVPLLGHKPTTPQLPASGAAEASAAKRPPELPVANPPLPSPHPSAGSRPLSSAPSRSPPPSQPEPTAGATTLRINAAQATKWESAAAEALELLTIASQDTAHSTRPSLAREASSASILPAPMSVKDTNASRWLDDGVVDCSDIHTVASLETMRPSREARAPPPVSREEQPAAGGGPMVPPAAKGPVTTTVQMLQQLRKQKHALEVQARSSAQALRGASDAQQSPIALLGRKQ